MRNCSGHSGHGVERRALCRRHRHDLELMHGRRLLPMRRAQAIRARIAAADDDHVLAGGENLVSAPRSPAHALVLLRQKIHREMDALQLAARDGQIARLLGAHRQHDRRRNRLRRSSSETLTPMCALVTNSTPSAAICSRRRSMHVLLHLEIGNAVAQQSADAVGFLEHRHRVPGARQLLRRGQARRTRSDHRHALAACASPEAPARIQPSSNA